MMRDSDLGKVLPWPYKLVVHTAVCRDNAWTVHSIGFYDFRLQFLVRDNFWLEFHQWNFKLPGSRNNSTTNTYVKGGLISENFSLNLRKFFTLAQIYTKNVSNHYSEVLSMLSFDW